MHKRTLHQANVLLERAICYCSLSIVLAVTAHGVPIDAIV
jgi:hypothetical protein